MLQLSEGSPVPFNQVSDQLNPDISYNSDTSVFTINRAGINNIYMINWWVFADGTTTNEPAIFSLNVGNTRYRVVAPWLETQLHGSALVNVGADTVEVSLTNETAVPVGIADTEVQAQIIIIGFGQST